MLHPDTIPFIQKLERYGTIIKDDIIDAQGDVMVLPNDTPYSEDTFAVQGLAHTLRIKLILLQHCLYYVKMVDGEYVQYALIGRMEHGQKK